MPTYGFRIDKETHTKYVKLTHLLGVSPYWFADQMRDKLNELINDLWEKRKEKTDKPDTIVIRDVIQAKEDTQAAEPEDDLNIYNPLVGIEDGKDE